MFAASWKSPSLAEPSPKYAIAHAGMPSSRRPIAYPTAWEICVAVGTQIGPNRVARGSYGPPCHVPRWYCMYWTGSTPADERHRQLPERREDEIVGPQGERRADLGGLLALERGIDGQLALALQRHAFAVQPAGEHHPAQQLSQFGGVQADVGIADRGAVGRDEAERLAPAPGIVRGQGFSSNAGNAESIGDAAVR